MMASTAESMIDRHRSSLAREPRLECHARERSCRMPGELALPVDVHLADRQVDGKVEPSRLRPLDFAADADDPRLAGRRYRAR